MPQSGIVLIYFWTKLYTSFSSHCNKITYFQTWCILW